MPKRLRFIRGDYVLVADDVTGEPVERTVVGVHHTEFEGITYDLDDGSSWGEDDLTPSLIWGDVHRCPKCGTEFGEKNDDRG